MRKGRTPSPGGPAFSSSLRFCCAASGGARLGAEDEAGVDPAESERIRQTEGGAIRPAATGDVIEVARIVAFLEVEGGRDPSSFEGEACDGGLDGAGCA